MCGVAVSDSVLVKQHASKMTQVEIGFAQLQEHITHFLKPLLSSKTNARPSAEFSEPKYNTLPKLKLHGMVYDPTPKLLWVVPSARMLNFRRARRHSHVLPGKVGTHSKHLDTDAQVELV